MNESSVVAIKPCLTAFDEARIRFIKYLDASGCSPNTVRAYGHDLTYLRSFLVEQALDWFGLTPTRGVDLLIHLREKQSYRRGSAQHPSLATMDGKPVVARLSGATINRVLSAVSSFYEWAKITEQFNGSNPIIRIEDRAPPMYPSATARFSPASCPGPQHAATCGRGRSIDCLGQWRTIKSRR